MVHGNVASAVAFPGECQATGWAQPENVPGPSRASQGTIEVVDSQEPVEEGGSKKRVMQMENGTQRNLTEQEEQEMLENELMEELAAEEMRLEEQRMWNDFHAADLRTWEAWAAETEGFLQGKRKRARVQVLVQGQGGRIIRRENWLVGLGQGERLSYSVSVITDEELEEDMERDPTATSSASGHQPEEGDEHKAAREEQSEKEAKDTLPVTGEHPDDMWEEEDVSVAKDISVDDFMQTQLAAKFYACWKQGAVTDRLIGQRFGYGVLGRFYSNRLWDDGCFDDVTSEGESGLARGETTRAEDSFPARQVEEEADNLPAAVDGAGAEVEGDPAANSSLTMEGSAAVPTSSTEVGATECTGVLAGSRQTSLAHWLL